MLHIISERAHHLVRATVVIGAAIGVSGCMYTYNNAVPGVPLDELDYAGATPVEIGLAGPDDLFLTVGDTLEIEVEGDSDVSKDLRFDLDGNSLNIGRESDWGNSDKVTIRVAMPAPETISLAGNGDISAETIAEDAELSVAGSGILTIDRIAAERLEVSMAGSGLLKGAGTASDLEISIAGSGDVDFAEFSAEIVEISIAGSGDVALASDGRVSASIAGSGNIDVIGSADCKLDSIGSGTLNCRPVAQAAATRADAEDAGE